MRNPEMLLKDWRVIALIFAVVLFAIFHYPRRMAKEYHDGPVPVRIDSTTAAKSVSP